MFYKKWFKEKVPPKDQLYVRDIIRKFLEDDKVQKLISPYSNEYYLINKKDDINICVMDGRIKISNHVFLYNQEFPIRFTDKLIVEIKNKIEEERQQLKNQTFKNEIELLRQIIKFEK